MSSRIITLFISGLLILCSIASFSSLSQGAYAKYYDMDGDGSDERVIDYNNDHNDGWEVFEDTSPNPNHDDAYSIQPIILRTGNVSITDADNDGKIDHFLGLCDCDVTEVVIYWDPDDDIITEILPSYIYDVNDDGNDDVTFDSTGDGTPDRWLNPRNQQISVLQTDPDNQSPTADASAGAPYAAEIGTYLLFDASASTDSDGSIASYYWDFGDGETATGDMVNHLYSSAGTYTVRLTVTDDDGASDSTSITATISSSGTTGNTAPTVPQINHPDSIQLNTDISFTFSSTDIDEDTLVYTVEWGDETQDRSGSLSSGSLYTRTHRYTTVGLYTLTCIVDDGTDTSEATVTLAFQAHAVGTIGVLLDTDNDGTYDQYASSDETVTTSPQKQDDGIYLIDTTDDGEWDYTYDLQTDQLTVYEDVDDPTPPAEDTPGFSMLLLLLGFFIVLLIDRRKM